MFLKIGVLKDFANFTGKHLCWSFFLKKSRALRREHFFYRTTPVAASENNEQQQCFAKSCYKKLSPIFPQELINDFAVCKHCSGTLLLVEDVTFVEDATVLEARTTYFKKEQRFLIDEPRTCRIFMLRCIKSMFFNYSGKFK